VLGTTLNQRFQLDRELGRGGMGAVYRATDQVLQRHVAIKVLKDLQGEDVGRRLRLEAQITARLVHDNIVRLYDFGLDGGTYFFVMEEVDGTSFLKRWRKIPIAERLRILAGVADALDYAHHQGVIHRDVKPANILLTAGDQPKLSDFGLSLLADAAADETGTARGTPHYMSPEQSRGKKLDYRSDLYALGIILYECVTGAPPFSGASLAIMAQHVNVAPEPPRTKAPECPAELEALILQLLEKDPAKRPASGAEVAARLREFLARAGGGGAPAATPPAGSPVAAVPPVAPPAVSPSSPPATATEAVLAGRSPSGELARRMVQEITAEPVALDADGRYLCGHYLAYLLGGSRRQGFLLRRPLDPLNADRARLLLAMTYLMVHGADDAAMALAAELLERRPDVRPLLSPPVVMKYLASRESARKRKEFRLVRQRLRESSPYAQASLTDAQGVLNPGLMPQVLDDLRKIAPERTEVDDELVDRWNRVAEVWRSNAAFREAVLRYATRRAHRDPASSRLWPEVVYPLIERARWQRHMRSRTEALWDAVAGGLHVGDAGVQMDRAFRQAVPEGVVEEVDEALVQFVDDPQLDEPAATESPEDEEARRISQASGALRAMDDLDAADSGERELLRLVDPDPVRLTLGELRTLWQQAMAAMRTPATAKAPAPVAIGPYRLAVVPSIRAKAGGLVALQGMPNKQVEMLVPSFTGGGSNGKVVAALWVYPNSSVVIAYNDHLNDDRYIVWDAPAGRQLNFDAADQLNSNLFKLGLEVPDQLDRVLTKKFRPARPV
jgi:serine/threonine-protein kinase